jgi:predicted metal-dependent enzyme (double-stranded beta helix superfamily)
MLNSFELFVSKLSTYGSDPSEAQLVEAARELLSVCENQKAFLCRFPAAKPGEELLYELAVASGSTPSIYLVSDGAGVVSPPHEHCTWAVIVGIRGTEMNSFFRRTSLGSAVVMPAQSVSVGAGEFLTMRTAAVHSTVTVGNESTFHVHLYGRSLVELPPFASRCFSVQNVE